MLDINENRALARTQAEMRFKAGDKNGDGRLERDEILEEFVRYYLENRER